jgi:hypothetical protein
MAISQSEVTISLAGSNTLSTATIGEPGLNCQDFSNVTFFSTASGSLSATGGDNAAAIGPDPTSRCGSLSFLNGTFTTLSGIYGAGIGSSFGDTETSSFHDLFFLDATVDSTSFQFGAGIGTGVSNSSGGRIVIEGGSITAGTRGQAGAIGTGLADTASNHLDQIAILNGNFTLPAPPDSSRVGIGSGASAAGLTNCIDNLVIANGSFTIGVVHSCAIGAGRNMNGGIDGIDTLWIQNGSFRINQSQTSVYGGAGIGTGQAYRSLTYVNSLVIDDGDFEIDSVTWGAPIGTGEASDFGQSHLGHLLIRNGKFDLYSATRAPCIGMSGIQYDGTAEIDNLTILDGDFQLRVHSVAPAIGLGRMNSGSSGTLHSLVIAGGSFNITSRDKGAGIGTGSAEGGATVRLDNLTILGGDFLISTQSMGAPIGTGHAQDGSTNSIGSILIMNGNFTLRAGADLFPGGAAIGTSSTFNSGSPKVRIDNITIAGGHFDLSVDEMEGASALGTGRADAPNSASIGHIAVLGGDFKVRGYAGIGSSPSGSVSSIVIGGGEPVSIRCESLGGPSCLNGENISLEGSVSIHLGSGRMGTDGSVSISEGTRLLVTYAGESEVNELGGGVLYVPEIPTIRSDYASFIIREVGADGRPFERNFEVELESSKSFRVNLLKDRDYDIRMAGVPSQSETIMKCNESVVFKVMDEEVLCHLFPDSTVLFSPMPGVSFAGRRMRLFSAMSFLWFIE